MKVISGIVSNLLSRYDDINHFITSAYPEGLAPAPFNLSMKVGNEKLAWDNRALLASELGIGATHLIFPEQTHSGNIVVVGEENIHGAFASTDALISGTKGVCIGVLAADCLPVLIYDHDKKVVAAIHAGWKGSLQKITYKTIMKMVENYGSLPANMVAYIGPSICRDCYEVGEDTAHHFVDTFYPDEIVVRRQGKIFLDLWLVNFIQLVKAGFDIAHIEISPYCTYENSRALFSARKNGYATGRFAAGIMLKPH